MQVDAFLEVLKSCIPYIIGALIAIVPISIERILDWQHRENEQQIQIKQEQYVELISLLGDLLSDPSGPSAQDTSEELRNNVNLIYITGSIDVVNALKNYLDTWGGNVSSEESYDEQNKKYTELIKAMRKDLRIDKKNSREFPDIGLVDFKNVGSL